MVEGVVYGAAKILKDVGSGGMGVINPNQAGGHIVPP